MNPGLIPRPKSTLGAFVELVVIVGVAIGLALLIQAFIVKPFQIPSGSMIPTLEVNQRVLVNRTAYGLFGDPKVGDIVVFHPPKNTNRCAGQPSDHAPCAVAQTERDSQNFIKRIVAGPGQTLSVKNGHPVLDGEQVEEDFVMPCRRGGDCNLPEEITIPPDHYFMMGDNRGASDDSRRWGPVPRDWIIGKSFATYWPPNRIGLF